MRGAWDARLEALVVDSVIRGEADESVRSRASALGWGSGTAGAGTAGSGEVAVVVGRAPSSEPGSTNVADAVRHAAREAGADALCAMQGDRLVVVLGGTSKPVETVQRLAEFFGPGPIVVGPLVPDLMAAVTSARAAVAGLRAAPAWPAAPRPVHADELLPERSLSGDGHARRQLATDVYGPLTMGDGVLLDTVSTYLDSGRFDRGDGPGDVHPPEYRPVQTETCGRDHGVLARQCPRQFHVACRTDPGSPAQPGPRCVRFIGFLQSRPGRIRATLRPGITSAQGELSRARHRRARTGRPDPRFPRALARGPRLREPAALAVRGRRARPRSLRHQGRRGHHPRHGDRAAAAGRVQHAGGPGGLPAPVRRVRPDGRGLRPQRR